MAAWLERLRRLSARLTPVSGDEAGSTLLVSDLGWQSSEVEGRESEVEGKTPGPSADRRPPTARFSVWERLAGDPGAAALRARWEARWDEF